jgi:hypothetical protein
VAGDGRWIVDLVEQIFLFLFFYSGLKKKKNYNRKYMQTKC